MCAGAYQQARGREGARCIHGFDIEFDCAACETEGFEPEEDAIPQDPLNPPRGSS